LAQCSELCWQLLVRQQSARSLGKDCRSSYKSCRRVQECAIFNAIQDALEADGPALINKVKGFIASKLRVVLVVVKPNGFC
ncbi:hypothetical protein Hamer_G017204, partial [Homarus americanus]